MAHHDIFVPVYHYLVRYLARDRFLAFACSNCVRDNGVCRRCHTFLYQGGMLLAGSYVPTIGAGEGRQHGPVVGRCRVRCAAQHGSGSDADDGDPCWVCASRLGMCRRRPKQCDGQAQAEHVADHLAAAAIVAASETRAILLQRCALGAPPERGRRVVLLGAEQGRRSEEQGTLCDTREDVRVSNCHVATAAAKNCALARAICCMRCCAPRRAVWQLLQQPAATARCHLNQAHGHQRAQQPCACSHGSSSRLPGTQDLPGMHGHAASQSQTQPLSKRHTVLMCTLLS